MRKLRPRFTIRSLLLATAIACPLFLTDRLHNGHPLPALLLRPDCSSLSLLPHHSNARGADARGLRHAARLVLPTLRLGVVGPASNPVCHEFVQV
jgi:hypothetical protein